MKGIVQINFEENGLYCNLEDTNRKDLNYIVSITMDKTKSFTNLLKEEQWVRDDILSQKKINKETKERIPKRIRNAAKHNFNFIKEAEYAIVGNTTEETIAYLMENPELKNKKIILPEGFMFYKEELDLIKEVIEPVKDANIYVYTSGNEDPISLKDYEKTIEAIDSIVNHIESYNYTPFEQLLHVYDIVRNRVLNKEQENDSYTESRDITKVLFGNKIVCAGFSEIFNEVIRKLGFMHTGIYRMKGETGYHAVNAVYVQDDKYALDGIYYFDVTLGVKTDENDLDYLYSYLGFAKTKSQIDYYYSDIIHNKRIAINPKDYPELVAQEDKYDQKRLRALKEMNFLSRVMHEEKKEYLLPNASRVDEEETLEDAIEFSELLGQPIDADTFLDAFVTVRKNEFYENEQQYPLDTTTMLAALSNSDFIYKDTEEDKLILLFFPMPRPYKIQRAYEKVEEYCTKTDIEKNIERTKVAKVLQKVYEQKTNE